MKFSHTALIIPQGVEPDSVSDAKTFDFETTEYTNDRSRIAKERAIDSGFIDEYAMRNYWNVVMGETNTICSSWGSVDKLESQLSGINQVKKTSKELDDTKKSVAVAVDDDDLKTVRNKIYSMYGNNAPLFEGYERLEFFVEVKWISSDEFFFHDLLPVWNSFSP